MICVDCLQVSQNPELALERFWRANLQSDVFVVPGNVQMMECVGCKE